MSIMKLDEALELVKAVILDALQRDIEIADDMPLIGNASHLDSMKLVEVCLALEDIADENGFEFDWTSSAAMSKSRSIFRSVHALAQEFAKQSEV